KVGEKTIRSDAHFFKAVEKLAQTCGEQVKQLILSRGAPISRQGVRRLAQLSAAEQQRLVQELLQGQRTKLSLPKKDPDQRLSLPAEPRALAARIVEKLGVEYARQAAAAL